MHDWAIKAGIITGNIKDQLQIVYEPDCASLSLQHAIFKNIENKSNDSKDDTKDDEKCDANNPTVKHISNPTDDLDNDTKEEKINDIKDNNDSEMIKALLKSINLSQYYQKFMDKGFFKIDDIKELSNDDLREYLEITNGLHSVKIHKMFKRYNKYEAKIDDINDNNVHSTNNLFQELHPQIDIDTVLNIGDKYILIDIGGGTCDFACHKIEDKCVISELYHPSGGSWGSNNINRMFTYYIDEIFGIESCQIYHIQSKQGRKGYIEFLANFETAKKQFGKTYMYNNKYCDVAIPKGFFNYLSIEWAKSMSNDDIIPKDSVLRHILKFKNNIGNRYITNKPCVKVDLSEVDTVIERMRESIQSKQKWQYYNVKMRQSKWNDINKITDVDHYNDECEYFKITSLNEDYYLSIHYNIWFLMFNEIIEPIINHCDKLLKMDELKDIKYMFLVGGFAESKYFQNHMKKYYKNIKVLIPNLPGLCVVDGASKYGLDPHFVKIRKMPKHYGVAVSQKKSQVSSEISEYYINENTVMDNNNVPYIKNIFERFVSKNESVKFDDKPKVHEASKWNENATKVTISIYSSIHDNPLTTDDCDKLAELEIDMPRNKQYMTIEFVFSETIFTVYAYETGKRQNKKKIVINYYDEPKKANEHQRSSWWPF